MVNSPSALVCAPSAASSFSASSRLAVWQTSSFPFSLSWAAQHCWWSAPSWDSSDSCLWLRTSRRSDYDSRASNYAMECWVDDGDPYYCHFHWWSCDADDDWGDAGWPSMRHCRASSSHSSGRVDRCSRACHCHRWPTIPSWSTRSTWGCAEWRWAVLPRADAMSSRCHLMDSMPTDSCHEMVGLRRVRALLMRAMTSCGPHAHHSRVFDVMDTSSGHNGSLNSTLKATMEKKKCIKKKCKIHRDEKKCELIMLWVIRPTSKREKRGKTTRRRKKSIKSAIFLRQPPAGGFFFHFSHHKKCFDRKCRSYRGRLGSPDCEFGAEVDCGVIKFWFE